MADETNNRNAVFKFYLNRQGVKGNKGEKGDQGFSPVIEVSENTANSYKLQITTETDQFETPNLRGDEIDTSQSGTYVRYNVETQQMYVAPADVASTNTQGEVTLASGNDVLMLSETKPITPAGIVNNYAGLFVSTDGSINISQDEISDKINLKANTSSIEGDISALTGRIAADEQLIQNNTLAIGNKVDKVTGKGLSTNDFTNEAEDKLTHAVIDTDLANVAFTGNYEDLINTPATYSSGLGININNANQISVKVDGTTVEYNLNGELTATGSSITVDQTFNAASQNAQSGVGIAGELDNYVTLGTAQTVTANKDLQGSGRIATGNSISSNNKFTLFPDDRTYSNMLQVYFKGFGASMPILGNIQGSTLTIDNVTRPVLAITPTTHNGEEGYVYIPNLVNENYKPYLNANKITSTGGTVTITDNGMNGINIEASGGGGGTPTNMVTTDTTQTISAEKEFSNRIVFGNKISFDSSSDYQYIAKEGGNGYENITIRGNTGTTDAVIKVGYEGTGTYYALGGYFFDVEDGGNGMWLGSANSRSCITKGNVNGDTVFIFPNPLQNNANERLAIGLNDVLTYRKADGTVVDLLALETRIAALEAIINGGNA